MQINKINQYNNQQSPNFKGYLKFQGDRYINANQINSILFDDVDSFIAADKNYTSSIFTMNDGKFYAVKYLQKPTKSLFNNVLAASLTPTNIIEIDGIVDVINELSTKKLIEEYHGKNLKIIESFKKYIKK